MWRELIASIVNNNISIKDTQRHNESVENKYHTVYLKYRVKHHEVLMKSHALVKHW